LILILLLGFVLFHYTDLFGSSGIGIKAPDENSPVIKNRMVESMKQSNESFVLENYNVELTKDRKKVIYFGIKNNINTISYSGEIFTVVFSCDEAFDTNANGSDITFTYRKDDKILGKDSIYIGEIIVSASPAAKSTTYFCSANLNIDDYHASKDFYLTLR